MAQMDNLVGDLQKNHRELSDMADAFKSALATSDHKRAIGILEKIDNMMRSHFTFEENYLHPRMRRLTFEIIEKLGDERKTIKEFLLETKETLNKDRLNKNRLLDLLEKFPVVNRHLENCNNLIFLADRFGKDERDDLTKKFKECCKKE